MRLHRPAVITTHWGRFNENRQHLRLAEWDRNTSSTRHNKNLVHNPDYLDIFRISSLSDTILLLWASLNIIVFIDFIDSFILLSSDSAPGKNRLMRITS